MRIHHHQGKASSPYMQRGVTLIELLIVVVILGLLASIALPNYIQYVERGRRAEAQTVLLEAQQFMQRLYNANNDYLVNGAQPQLPDAVRTAPVGSNTPTYDISVAATNTTFVLTATPRAGGPMSQDRCGALSINQRNAKSVSGAGQSAADCWR